MRTSYMKVALAAASVVGLMSSAQASVLLNLQDQTTLAQKTCNTAFASVNVAGGNCAAVDGFSILGGGLGISFAGAVGGWDVFTTTFASNVPGTPNAATLNASTTQLKKNSAGTGDFLIDLTGFDYTLPSGALKTLSGNASLTSSDSSFGAGNLVLSEFYADALNLGGKGTPILSCQMALSGNDSCGAGQIQWADPGQGTFSMRDIQIVRLDQGKLANTTLSGTVGRIPEPMSLSLVGIALLAAGAAARRRASKTV